MVKRIFILLGIGIIGIALFFHIEKSYALAKKPTIVIKRPDIVVEKVKVTSEKANKPGKVRIKIEFILFNNSSVPTRCCPTKEGKKACEYPLDENCFKVRVESRSVPNEKFHSLTNGFKLVTLLKPYERQKWTVTEIISVPDSRQYRITADYGNWINEKNENNNVKLAKWPTWIV